MTRWYSGTPYDIVGHMALTNGYWTRRMVRASAQCFSRP